MADGLNRIPKPVIAWGSVALLVLLLLTNQGFRKLFRFYFERRRLEAALVELRQDHESLTRELKRIQTDPAYTEYLIRKNIRYVKKNEVEYRILKEKK